VIALIDNVLFLNSPLLLLLAVPVLYVLVRTAKGRRFMWRAVVLYLLLWAAGATYVRDPFNIQRKRITRSWAEAMGAFHEKTGTYPLHEIAVTSRVAVVWIPNHLTSPHPIDVSDLEAALRAEGIQPRTPKMLRHRRVTYQYVNQVTNCLVGATRNRGGWFLMTAQGEVVP
jgi:hypothetical protein